MARPRRQKFVAEAFAKRLQSAMESNPNCPPKYQGERKWLVERLLKLGMPVSIETVRKWVEGETLPAPDKFPALAEALGVDVQWMMFGDQIEESITPAHSFTAAPLANLVAGIIGLDGGTVSFPADDARVKAAGQVHLHAIVKGANYPLHVVGGTANDNGLTFRVPQQREGVIVIGVVPKDGFAFDLYELDEGAIEGHGHYDRGAIEVSGKPGSFKQIRSFKERL